MTTTTTTQPTGRHAVLWAVMVAALAVHNIEEWLLDMTGWIDAHPWLPVGALHGDQAQFAFALALVTAVVFLVGVVAVAFKPPWSAEVLVCVAYALMFNALSHVVMSVASWSLMPGVITGVFILVPAGVLTARSLPPMRWTTAAVVQTAIAALGLMGGSLGLAALLTSIS